VMGIISEANRHPRDVPFVCEFCGGHTVLGTISPSKNPNFSNFTTRADLIV